MKISQIKIIKPFLTQLKCDKETLLNASNNKSFPLSTKPRQVFEAHYSHVLPLKTKAMLLSLNKTFLEELNLEVEDEEILSGNKVLEDSFPWAANYGGHQFGSWAGQLGDGRAISLFQAELDGRMLEFQLKGAGLTPYSRFADGFAVLRSSIREYLCAEAMNALGIPSSRSLSLHLTDQVVQRENLEKGAIVCRVAPTWIRFGSFELFYARNDLENLQKLFEYCCEYFFSESTKLNPHQRCQKMLEKIVLDTAEMIAHWQAIGFCHGVMNTDNFSILGITIDYGPFQFLDSYDPEYICNHSDDGGRYRFSAQPGVGLWNLTRLATVLSPIIQKELGDNITSKDVSEVIKPLLELYISRIKEKYDQLICAKFGFKTPTKEILETVIHPGLELMEKAEMDYTIFLRTISQTCFVNEQISNEILNDWIGASYKSPSEFFKIDKEQGQSLSSMLSIWYVEFRAAHRIQNIIDDKERQEFMMAKNPKYTLRNHFAQLVIEKAESGDHSAIDRYLAVLLDPFSEGSTEQFAEFGGKVPNSSRKFKCSCSS